MDPVTLGMGVLAIAFGGYTSFLRATNPSKLKKLRPMQTMWGERTGFVLHTVAYSIAPLALKAVMVFAGFKGVSLF